MSEGSDNRNVRNDEIDLLDLLARIGKTLSRWLNALGTALLIAIVFIIKRWLPLGLSILFGFGVSALLKKTSTPFYTSDIVFKNNAVATSDIIPYFNKIRSYSLAGNTNALAEALSLDLEIAKNITDITCYWLLDLNQDSIPDYTDYKGTINAADTTNFKLRMQDRFNIRVRMKASQEMISVRNGLIAYIEKDSLFRQLNRVRLNQSSELIARLDYDILQLDSLQQVKYFEETRNSKSQSGSQMIYLQAPSTQLVYNDIYSLYDKKLALESELELYSGVVTVLSDFSLPVKSAKSEDYYGNLIVPFCFGLTLLILILVANRKKLKAVYNKYK